MVLEQVMKTIELATLASKLDSIETELMRDHQIGSDSIGIVVSCRDGDKVLGEFGVNDIEVQKYDKQQDEREGPATIGYRIALVCKVEKK